RYGDRPRLARVARSLEARRLVSIPPEACARTAAAIATTLRLWRERIRRVRAGGMTMLWRTMPWKTRLPRYTSVLVAAGILIVMAALNRDAGVSAAERGGLQERFRFVEDELPVPP